MLTCNSFTDASSLCVSYNLSSSSPLHYHLRLILFGSATSPNFAPTCDSFTDPLSLCFRYNLSSSSHLQYPLGHILVGSVTFPIVAPTCNSFTHPTGSCFSYNLSKSSPLHHHLRLILFGSATSPNFAPTCNSFTDLTGLCFRNNLICPWKLVLFLNVSMTSVIWFWVLFCTFHALYSSTTLYSSFAFVWYLRYPSSTTQLWILQSASIA